MNEIKTRLKSVNSTMQITKAMELVATSKLRRAKAKVESSRHFHETLRSAIGELCSAAEIGDSIWSRTVSSGKTLFIVIAGDRGLAGGFNSNIFRLVRELAEGTEPIYLPIGKKALEHYKHRAAAIYSTALPEADDVTVGDALAIAEQIAESFKSGEFDRAVIVYTHFASMMSEIPTHATLLPLSTENSEKKEASDPIWDGDPEEILDRIVPEYLGGMINSAVRESLASESSARRNAMSSANKNAEEMIDSLMLRYNRERQAVITQEITEIISGSG